MINLNEIRKLAGLTMQEALQTQEDTEDFEERLNDALTIKPVKYSGTAKVYEGDIDIEMSNGDKLNFSYHSSMMPGSAWSATLTINGKQHELKQPGAEDQLEEITKLYHASLK